MGLRLAIACSSLCISRGGSERVATYLAEEMANRGHAVLLLSSTFPVDKVTEPCYGLPHGVRHMVIDSRGRHADLRHLREFLISDKTDVFLSMQSDSAHLQWAMACMGSGIPFICSERVDPEIYIENIAWNKPGRYAVLAGADCIHELLPIYIDTIPEPFRHKVHVIPNAVPQKVKPADPVGFGRKKLLYLARLCEQKRPVLLLKAFELIKDKFPDWDLIIWGHGPHEKYVKKYSFAKNNAERIQYRGVCKDTESAYAESQIYCLPSYFEGFPNTVLEAMSAGLPVAGFKNCKGVAGVVQDKTTGLLAKEDTPEALAEILAILMADAELRCKMGQAGKAVSEKFQAKKIYDQWETLFTEMAALKNNTVMDSLYKEPMASRLTLSAAARREYIYRNFGEAMPYSFRWWREKAGNFLNNATKSLKIKLMKTAKQI